MKLNHGVFGNILSEILPATSSLSSNSVLSYNNYQGTIVPYGYNVTYDGAFSGLNSAQMKVNEFGRMHENWDGYGAEPIGPITSGNTINALNVLSNQLPMPDITPNSNGTLSLLWETNAGAAHLEVGRTTCSLYIQPQANAQPYYFYGTPAEIGFGVGALLYGTLYAPLKRSTPINQISGTGHVR